VIETGAIRKLSCSFLFAFYSNCGRTCSRLRYLVSKSDVTLKAGFLFAFHSNYGDILYRLRDIATYWYKIAKFLYPTCI